MPEVTLLMRATVVGNLGGKVMPPGFYYKTFMYPQSMWPTYEKFIRKAAGLGRAPREKDPDIYDAMNQHCDVMIVGAGVGRSFKYSRPRGIVAAGAEEPNAVLQLGASEATQVPNVRATQQTLYEGLVCSATNGWPSVESDLMGLYTLNEQPEAGEQG
ncbi:hypothetical protein CRX72_21255 [Pantoea sp. BRM17]|nr:hypothetical protein CRX72_21255 [Pantoea sp. BRM17]